MAQSSDKTCFTGEGNGSPLQYSCLENPMGRGVRWATVNGVTKSRTRLSDFTSLHFKAYLRISLSSVQFSCSFVTDWTPWTAARKSSLSITNSWSLLKLMSIESVMPSNHLILCRPLLLPPSIFPSIRIFSNKSALCLLWLTKYNWSDVWSMRYHF